MSRRCRPGLPPDILPSPSLHHHPHAHPHPPTTSRTQTINYGLRGLAAYSHHAEVLGHRDADVDAFLAEAYAFLCSEEALDLGKV